MILIKIHFWRLCSAECNETTNWGPQILKATGQMFCHTARKVFGHFYSPAENVQIHLLKPQRLVNLVKQSAARGVLN